jgi:beta-N-acetylhexosaminidase
MGLSLRHAVGSLLVVGLEGAELSALERAWMRAVRPAGVILFRRNIQDAKQTRSLLESATELCAPNAFRCVDVEGGTVDRLRDALAAMPNAQSVALADRASSSPTLAQSSRKDGAPRVRGAARGSFARMHGELIGRGGKAFGFNTTLAPVLDLGVAESAGVMGSRTAGAIAEEVITYAREFLAGLKSQGVAGCGKHFPGLGGGRLDSHFETPRIERGFMTLEREDLEPYRALAHDLPMVMVNHATYPETKGGDVPATASPFWIEKVLRGKLGYRGIVFSDDLEMGGILKRMPMEEAAVAAIRAGMDTVEICHSPELILRAYEGLLSEAERSAAFRKIVEDRSREVARKRARLFATGPGRPLAPSQLESLRKKIDGFREKVISIAGEQAQSPKAQPPVVESA